MMKRIDTVEYMKRFQAYLRDQGITQLTEFDDTGEELYCAMQVDNLVDFDCIWWNSAVAAIARAIMEHDSGEYYALGVYSNDSGLIGLSSSRGLLTGRDCDGSCIIEGGNCV